MIDRHVWAITHNDTGVYSACNSYFVLGIFQRVKGGQHVRLTNPGPIVYKMWEPRRLTALWASTTRCKDSFTFLCLHVVNCDKSG
jgi:hypothetical protein